jgi:proteasome lid subunit RPN8/RPN11
MDVHIASDLLERILTDASADDDEICGLLTGSASAIAATLPCQNVAADPRRRFEIDPVALIAAHRAARQDGTAVIGHYHSHPTGNPIPSACDAAEAAPDGSVWLIVAGREVRAWRAVAVGPVQGRFEPLRLCITPPCAATAAPPEEGG